MKGLSLNSRYLKKWGGVMLGIVTSLLLVTGIVSAATAWVNGQAADLVLGQATFTTNATGAGLNQMNNPYGVTIDPTTHKVFVVDINNCRVLRFTSAATLANGAAAEFQFGTTGGCTTTNATFNFPLNLFVDSVGRLWVVDRGNNRVLRFDNAATTGSSTASGVLGQADYVSGLPNRGGAVAANTMNNPTGVWGDSNGRLWVADELNHRVLRFDNPVAASNAPGGNADGVLGQIDFISNGSATTQAGLKNPTGVVGDGAGNLYVADFFNHRVLRFNNAASKANGDPADGVLGQIDFISGSANAGGPTSASGLNRPVGVALDSLGRLYVSDRGNQRILIWNNAATLGNGVVADNVLGQANFTANGSGTSSTNLNQPNYIFFGAGALWVPDSSNHRVVRFGGAVVAVTAAVGGVAEYYKPAQVSMVSGYGVYGLLGAVVMGLVGLGAVVVARRG